MGIIKTYDEFIKESVWADIYDRSTGNSVKREDGREIGVLEDGTRLFLPNKAFGKGDLVTFDDDQKYYYLEDADAYVAVMEGDDIDTYYRLDPNTDEVINMVESFEADEVLRRDDFEMFKAIILEANYMSDDFDNLIVTYNSSDKFVEFKCGREEYMVFWSEYDARRYAFDIEKDLLESSMTEENIKSFYNEFGDSICNVDAMEDALRESDESYFYDMDEEEAIEELLNWEVIEDTEEYFELDEDGEPDHTQPKFDYNDYCEAYVDKRIEDINDIAEEFFSIFGTDGAEDYIDLDKLTDEILDGDGLGNTLASYDSKDREQTIGDTTYYIYKING